ncbi:MAG: class I SAM-dependent methyltransferase [Chromatiales bacterium]|nr:class I SAM-dependent methyltransferase [Chromatiales bacterium]
MIIRKPYAESCDENGPPILEVLRRELPASGDLLEIGSGTGQHAVMFATALPDIQWHTSDMIEMHDGIQMWLDEVSHPNLHPPIRLNVLSDPWPEQRYDAIYSANTAHIMSEEAVEAMFRGAGKVLKPASSFLLYGPFMYDGEHTSESNARFELWLKSQGDHQGIRDVSWLKEIASSAGLELEKDIEMPANNRILLWQR